MIDKYLFDIMIFCTSDFTRRLRTRRKINIGLKPWQRTLSSLTSVTKPRTPPSHKTPVKRKLMLRRVLPKRVESIKVWILLSQIL